MTALDFIEHRESGKPPSELSFWRQKSMRGQKQYVVMVIALLYGAINQSISYQHILTKTKSSDCHESRGGIIADDMGLGKSLTILSVIAKSLPDASEFVSTWNADANEKSQVTLASRATLIIVPSTSNYALGWCVLDITY
jgi:SWI/SNF-related matrix-associated actin-dependent regulator of chromatin subfamily A3